MEFYDVVWRSRYVEKLAVKHKVTTDEVEEVLFSYPFIRFGEKGRVRGENLYIAYGQTNAGRYLIIFFVYKTDKVALPISARDMTPSERRRYRGRKT